MLPVVVQAVALHVVTVSHRYLVSVVASITRQPAQPAVDLPPSHLFLAKIVPSIVATASRPSGLLAAPVATTRVATAVAVAVRVVVAAIGETAATTAIAGKTTQRTYNR